MKNEMKNYIKAKYIAKIVFNYYAGFSR